LGQDEVWIIDNLLTGSPPAQWLPSGFELERREGALEVYTNRSQTIVFIREDVIDVLAKWLGEGEGADNFPRFGDVFHLASIVGGRQLIDGDPLLVAVDLAIDAFFFRWVSRPPARAERILYASSSAAYPIDLQSEGRAVALKEEYIRFDSRLALPDMTYGWSKLSGEYLARLAHERYGLQVACVRPFSGYGEDQDLSYPIPAIARRAALRQNPLEVWGTGEQGRDFVHIDDCIEAMLLALDKIKDGKGINIGSGTLTSFLQIAELCAEIVGYKPRIKPMLHMPQGVESRFADVSTMKTLLNWEPRISLRQGLARVLQYVEERLSSTISSRS
jgi:nucleoside-diphosphate-sugar epimerase